VADRQQTNTHKRSYFVGEMYSTICVQWAIDNFGLGSK